MKAKHIVILLLLGAIAGTELLQVRDARRTALSACVGATEGTDSACDSCYHAIYGASDKECGLCE